MDKQIIIYSHHHTYFFISSSTAESILYYIKYDISEKSSNYEEGNSQDLQFIKLKNTSLAKSIFKLNPKSNFERRISHKKLASISFISFENSDECSNGIEFISSEADLEKQEKIQNKCFYLPPTEITPASLYTYNREYKSSLMKRSHGIDFTQFHTKDFKKKEKRDNSLKNYLNQNHIKKIQKNSEKINILSAQTTKSDENNLNQNHLKKTNLVKTNSFTFVMFLILFACAFTFLIFLCTGKESVSPSDSDPNQSNKFQIIPPTSSSQDSPLTINYQHMNDVYLDPNMVYSGVIPYQGAKPMKKHMKDNVDEGIVNAKVFGNC